MPFLKAWAATAAVFLLLDGIWLGLIARSFYREKLGFLMKDNINFGVAALFYLIYTAAIIYLASLPGHRAGSAAAAVTAGAVLGIAAYGTYDITNLATLKNWPLSVSLVDLAWGTAVTAAAAYAGYRALAAFS